MVVRFVSAHELQQSGIIAKNGFKLLPGESRRLSFAHDVDNRAFDIANAVFEIRRFQELFFIDLEDSWSAGVIPNRQTANFWIVGIADQDKSRMVVVAEGRENGFVVIIAEHAGIKVYAIQFGAHHYRAVAAVLEGTRLNDDMTSFQLAFQTDRRAATLQFSLAFSG